MLDLQALYRGAEALLALQDGLPSSPNHCILLRSLLLPCQPPFGRHLLLIILSAFLGACLTSGAKKDSQSQTIARTAPKNFLNNSKGYRSLPSQAWVVRQIAPESSSERSAKSLSRSFFVVPFLSPKKGTTVVTGDFAGIGLLPVRAKRVLRNDKHVFLGTCRLKACSKVVYRSLMYFYERKRPKSALEEGSSGSVCKLQ